LGQDQIQLKYENSDFTVLHEEEFDFLVKSVPYFVS